MTKPYYAANKHEYMRYDSDNFSQYIYNLIRPEDFKNFPTAIEFGAGMGRFSAPLITDFRQVILVEPTPAYAAILKKSFPQEYVHIFQGKFQELIENGTIQPNTMVFCFHLLHHLSSQERGTLYRFIRDIKAKAVFVEPNPFNPLILAQVLIHPDMSMAEEYQYLLLTRQRYRRELAKHGLRLVSYKRICTLPPFLMNLLLKKIPSNTFNKLEFLARHIPFFGSYHVIICN